MKIRGPLRFGHCWVWLFPTDWALVREPKRLQVGPVLIDWWWDPRLDQLRSKA